MASKQVHNLTHERARIVNETEWHRDDSMNERRANKKDAAKNTMNEKKREKRIKNKSN